MRKIKNCRKKGSRREEKKLMRISGNALLCVQFSTASFCCLLFHPFWRSFLHFNNVSSPALGLSFFFCLHHMKCKFVSEIKEETWVQIHKKEIFSYYLFIRESRVRSVIQQTRQYRINKKKEKFTSLYFVLMKFSISFVSNALHRLHEWHEVFQGALLPEKIFLLLRNIILH